MVHDTLAIGNMDGREAPRMRCYYQVLHELARCLPLTSGIPSQEPMSFYKLLLRGVRVEPCLGNATYLPLYNEARKTLATSH